jgi:PAS domain S-box-containing protein
VSNPGNFQPVQANILLVDDRPANLLALEAVLKPLGHRLVPAHSGAEALKRLLEEEFAVILMDVQMPGLDGYQTVALIKQRERCRQVPILFVTAINKDLEHVVKGYSCGAVDYILKPIEPFVLRAKVAALVDLYLKEQRVKADQEKLRVAEREAQAQRTEARFRSLTESIPLCVWAADADGRVQYCNRAWLDYSGLSAEASAGLGFMNAIHPQQRDQVRSAWRESVQAGRPFEMEFLLRRERDGAHGWHLCRAVPERDDKGNVTGWIATATDIDAQKRSEQERARTLAAEQHAREVAEAANRSKDQFLALLSHELRNPLNSILGWARMLHCGNLDGERGARAIAAIERNAEAQAKLVEDLLDISHVVAGKLRVQRRRASLGRVVKLAADTVRLEAEAKQIQLDVAVDATDDSILADTDRLQQVVWNLLSNAIKFTPSGGRVEVDVRRVGLEVELRITDTGRGIAESLLPDIFERFHQTDSPTTRAHSGLGLGLAIARHLVELHEGTIRAGSPGEGKGSTFSVRLPWYAATVDQLQPEDSEADAQDGNVSDLHGLKVLFVDDQPDARELMAELLELHGASVVVADSAAHALKAMDEAALDVLVSDIGMPDEDGYELIRKIRARGSERGGNIPAIAVTGFATAVDNRHAISEGFQFALAKPIDPGAFLSAVAKLGRAGDLRLSREGKQLAPADLELPSPVPRSAAALPK